MKALGREVSVMREGCSEGVYIDGVDPLCALIGGQTPPFVSNRGIGAMCSCSYGLPEYGGDCEDEPHKIMDEHS